MINLKVVTPDGIIWGKPVPSINLNTTLGEITVLPRHIPLIATLEKGIMKLSHEGKEFKAEYSGGVLEVRKGSEAVILSSHSTSFVKEEG